MTEFPDPPEKTAADLVYTAVTAAASGIPIVGGSVVEFVDGVLGPPIGRRIEDWYQRVADAIRTLQDEHVPVDSPEFVTAVAHATRVALGTHLEEKLQMLQSAIVNAALPGSPADFMTHRYLRYVDELSPEHVIVLSFLRDQEGWCRRKGITVDLEARREGNQMHEQLFHKYGASQVAAVISQVELPVNLAALELVVQDLAERRLVEPNTTLEGMVKNGVPYQNYATPLGVEFLEFVGYMHGPATSEDA